MKEVKRRTRVSAFSPADRAVIGFAGPWLCGALLWEIHEKWQLDSPLLREV
jgi:hypothetical protein